MTHGDKDKAKTPASKASGKTSSKAGEALKAGAGGKKGIPAAEKAAAGSQKGSPGKGENGRRAKAGPETVAKARPETVAKAGAQGGSKAGPAQPKAGGQTDAKGRAVRGSDAPAFNNPLVADAFKRAIKKYPNAFRRLTD